MNEIKFEELRVDYVQDQFEAEQGKAIFKNQLEFYITDMGMSPREIMEYFGVNTREDKNNLTHLPKTEKGKLLWKKIYQSMCRLDKIYHDDKLKKPTYKDYADNLAGAKNLFGYNGEPYKQRILRDINKAGKAGLLE